MQHFYPHADPAVHPLESNKNETAPPKRAGHLEFLEGGQVKKITQRVAIAGNFTAKELEAFFTEENCSNNILSKLGSGDHAISLRYDAKKWWVFDSNYNTPHRRHEICLNWPRSKKRTQQGKLYLKQTTNSDRNPLATLTYGLATAAAGKNSLQWHKGEISFVDLGLPNDTDFTIKELQPFLPLILAHATENGDLPPVSLEKVFDDKAAAIAEILSIFKANKGSVAISLEFANVDPETQLKPITVSWQAAHLKNRGFHSLAHHTPENLPNIWQLATSDEDIKTALSDALTEKQEHGWTGFQVVACYAPTELVTLFTLAKKQSQIKTALSKALTEQNNNRWTVLHTMAVYAPTQLDGLFDLAREQPEIATALANALLKQDNEGWTTLHTMARYAPKQLVGLFNLAREQPEIATALANALLKQDNEGSTTLHTMAVYTPTQLDGLFALAKESAQIKLALNNALSPLKQQITQNFATTQPNLTFCYTIARACPEIETALAEALTRLEPYNNRRSYKTNFQTIAQNEPAQLAGLFDLANEKPKIAAAVATALIREDPLNEPALQTIFKNAPTQLDGLFTLANKQPKIKAVLIKTLAQRNNQGWTGLHTIISCAQPREPQQKHAFIALLTLAKECPKIRTAVAKALTLKNPSGDSNFAWIAKHCPQAFTMLNTGLLRQELAPLIKDQLFSFMPKTGNPTLPLSAANELLQFNLTRTIGILQKQSYNCVFWHKPLKAKKIKTLETLHQIIKQLNGKQVIFNFDLYRDRQGIAYENALEKIKNIYQSPDITAITAGYFSQRTKNLLEETFTLIAYGFMTDYEEQDLKSNWPKLQELTEIVPSLKPCLAKVLAFTNKEGKSNYQRLSAALPSYTDQLASLHPNYTPRI